MQKFILLNLILFLNNRLLIAFCGQKSKKRIEQIGQINNSSVASENLSSSVSGINTELQANIVKIEKYNPFGFEQLTLSRTAYFSRLLKTGLVRGTESHIKAFIEFTDKNGNSSFHYACSIDALDILNFIISNYPEMLLNVNKDGCTGLHIAAVHKSHACIRALILNSPFLINFSDRKYNTPVHYSFLLEDIISSELFLNHPLTDINLVNYNKLSIVDIAIAKDNPNLQDLILVKLLKSIYNSQKPI